MTLQNDSIECAVKFLKQRGFTKSDFKEFGGLYEAVLSLDLAEEIFDEITDTVTISNSEAIQFLKRESIEDIKSAFEEYTYVQDWEKSTEFVDHFDEIDTVSEFISYAQGDADLWEEVKMFVIDSIVGDIGFGYKMFDEPLFWDAVERKL